MKKILLVLMVMIPVLSGCFVVIDDIPTIFTVTNASFSTNYQLEFIEDNNERVQRNVICDDKTTTLIYKFTFTGILDSFRSYLSGYDTGQIPSDGDKTFTKSDINLTSGVPVEVEYTIPARLAPLSNDSLEPSVILREIKGYSLLHLDFPGASQDKISLFDNSKYPGIPVVGNCIELGL